MTYSSKTLANIAWHLSGQRTFLVPLGVGAIIAGIAIQPFKGSFPALALWAGMFVGAIVIGFILCNFYAPVAGKSILRAIERDYGPKTCNAVYTLFAEIKEGDESGVDIPELAKSLGEA